MNEIVVAMTLYAVIVMLLIGLILLAKRTLIPGGNVKVRVNQQQEIVTGQAAPSNVEQLRAGR